MPTRLLLVTVALLLGLVPAGTAAAATSPYRVPPTPLAYAEQGLARGDLTRYPTSRVPRWTRPTRTARALTPERFGAVGDGVADDTLAVQRALDAVPAGGTVLLGDGKVYRHTDVLRVGVRGTHLTGAAVLLATAEARSAVLIAADEVVVDGGLTIRTTGTTRRWEAYEQMGVRLAGTSGTVLRDVVVQGSAAAGIYVGASSRFLLQDVRVDDTRADGIHVTEGSHDGRVVRPVVRRSGDDAVAVVSYGTQQMSHDIVVQSPVVRTTTWGRGLAVVGGEDIAFRDVDVDRTSGAAVYVADEGAPYYTHSARRVSVSGGRLSNANTSSAVAHGAVMLYSGRTGYVVEDVTVEGLTVTATRSGAPWSVGLVSDGGRITRAMLRAIALVDSSSGLGGNVPPGSYSSVGWTWDGIALADHVGY